MNKSLLLPILVIILGVFLLLHNFIKINLAYIIIPIIIITVTINVFKRVIKLNIDKFNVKNNIFNVNYENRNIYGIILKIIGKVEPNTRIDIDKELKDLINAIVRKESKFKYLLLTSIEKGKLGSSIVIYTTANSKDFNLNELIEEINNIKILANAIAPHIELKIVNASKDLIPAPISFGNYPFLTVSELVYDSPINSNIVNEDFDIELGEATNGVVKSKIGIRTQDITRHIGIFGSTGSGKTNTAMVIAKQLSSKEIKVVIFDWHGEYTEVLKDSFMIYDDTNPLKVNPLQLIDFNIEDIVDIIGDVLELTDPQRFLLYVVLLNLKKFKKFSINQIIENLSSIEDSSYWMRDVKYALLRKIFVLFSDTATKLFDNENIMDVNQFLKYFSRSAIINLSSISNIKLRKLYALFLIKLLTEAYIRYKPKEKMLIIIDEAHNYFSNNTNSFLDRIVSEIRKYNIGLCFITQSPSLLSQTVIKNTNIKIIHSIKSDIDKKAIRDTLSLDDRLAQSLDKLDIGEAIVSTPKLRIPIIVKIKKI
ncbi:MAG: helicase HerA-like domain-containing protein [Saccharolobus sp.]|jgi:ABC-type dipeptide/oligopeptide/nickel transport system ATPase subunit